MQGIDDLADEDRQSHLEIIQLKNNKIRHIPATISLFSKLHDIDLSYNQLRELPPALGLLTQLKRLNVEHNCLTLLPCSVSELTELVFLLASDNQLTALPSLTRCKQFQGVQLANNKLNTVYDDNGNCIIPPTVWYLSIDGNQLSKNEMQNYYKTIKSIMQNILLFPSTSVFVHTARA